MEHKHRFTRYRHYGECGHHRPTAPVLSGPATGLITPPSRVALTWQASQDPDVTAEGDQLVYDVYFGAQNPPTSTFANCMGITQPRCIIDSLAPSTNYYWQVKARDRANETLPSLSSGINNLGTDNSVLARWSFDDGPNGLCAGDDPSLRGIRVCDKSGNGKNAVLSNTGGISSPSWLINEDAFLGNTMQSILGNALGFQTNVYAITTNPHLLTRGISQGSIEFWFDPLRQTTGDEHLLFYSNDHDDTRTPSNLKRFVVQYDGTSGQIHFITNDGTLNTLTSSQTLQLNSWNHIICSFGFSGKKIYINGVLVTPPDSTVVSLPNYQGDSLMGWDHLSPGNPSISPGYVYGVLDELTVYNNDVSPNIVTSLFNAH